MSTEKSKKKNIDGIFTFLIFWISAKGKTKYFTKPDESTSEAFGWNHYFKSWSISNKTSSCSTQKPFKAKSIANQEKVCLSKFFPIL